MKLTEVVKQGKGYGSLQLKPTSATAIKKVLKDIGIEDVINDLHITTIYDASNPTSDIKLDSSKTYDANVVDIKKLGEPGTKWYAIALTLEAPDIEKRHQDYIDAGFKHSYPEFLAHMSLKYKPSKEDINTIEDNLDMFKGLELVFSGERLAVIKE